MDDGSGLRNWGGCYPPIKENLGLQLRSTTTERDTKHFIPGRNSTSMMVNSSGAYHHNQHHQHHNHRDYGLSEPQIPMEFDWITHSHRERYLQMLPINSNYIPETSGSHNHQLQILQQQPDSMKDESLVRMEEVPNKGNGPLKKRLGGRTPKSPKPKKSKKDVLKDGSNSSVVRAKSMRKNMGVVINGIDIDLSGIPIPVCSCTGAPQQCYRWGCGGWQSACCTTSISMHPLPMSNKRRGARIAGRKMSLGAFKKVLEKLTSEGYNFSNPIDLRTHWAKHGTNKFVTIR